MGAVGPKRLFKYADRRGAGRVVLVAPEELKSGCVVVRDMTNGSQSAVAISDVAMTIQGQCRA
jgi:histidyl-tRNA synthetase